MSSTTEVFEEDGPLARLVDDYRVREQQVAMADAAARTLERRAVLACEAGTGTGKTIAYLVPALLSGQRVVVSTGTKNLQDQLFHRDLPIVKEALASSASVALLKGRANYLCRHRLGDTETMSLRLELSTLSDLSDIREWAAQTRTGDTAELTSVGENSPAWRLVTSTADNCLGTECPSYADCHVVNARKRALEADLVVVNHHILFADMALREEGFAELLPSTDAVIVDEAHQLPGLATRFFGVALSSGQLNELARDAANAIRLEASDVEGLPDLARELEVRVNAMLRALGDQPAKTAWSSVESRPAVSESRDGLSSALARLGEGLEAVAERGKAVQSVERRCRGLIDRLELVTAPQSDEWVQWIERHARGFLMHLSPMDVSAMFSARMAEYDCAWIFTSATLAVCGRIEHFTRRLGLDDCDTHVWESPFDFARQAMCFVPPDLPEPRDPRYGAGVLTYAEAVLDASGGRAFLLFTSHGALSRAAEALRKRIDYPMLVQGDAPRDELLRRFRDTPRAVLLGTASFWEGVDVRGEALSCVIIDKLPFAPPDDPINEARYRALRERGEDPFVTDQLPQAVLSLKQGVGRLIRDERDRGVIVICDPRLLSKGYGRVFWQSLPKMPLTRSLDAVRGFFAADGQRA